ncbi:hypothetical protein C3K47_16690 [Solitalea longa]|uniref:Uncharacterized protein n=1 Tax=Solitalea longa TaxID=2079460 RepID=A0A2S4ZXZ0_9SPHI|nr:hypothetical protein [Solitalea longa]POY35214.1 hypothetical protein C3K47_16690 [Solitalea longa]
MKTDVHHSPLYWAVMLFTGLFIVGIVIKVFSFFFNPTIGFGAALTTISWYAFLPGAAGLLVLMLVHTIFHKELD